jgi:phage-related protein
MSDRDKPILWVGSALADPCRLPEAARRAAGHQLRRVQAGLPPDDWKPMPIIGAGVGEIRVQRGAAYRVFYVAKFEEAVFVLHAFEKRTRKTRAMDLDLARARLAEVVRQRMRLQEG